MYCSICGKEIQPGVKFCPFCGAELGFNKDEKSFKFKVLVIAIPLIVLLVAGSVWAAVSTGVFLNPRQYYMLVEGKNSLQKVEEIKAALKSSVNKYESAAKDKPSSIDVKLQLAIDDTGMPEPMKKTFDFANALRVHFKVDKNPNDLQSMQDIGLSVNDTELANLKLYWDKTRIYAEAPVILDKYFKLDLQNLKATADNLGIDSTFLPDNITEEDIRKATGISNEVSKEDKISPLLKKYGKLYFDSIPDACLKLEKGASLELEGRNIKCSKLSLRFNEEQLKDLILVFTSALKDDEDLFQLLSDGMKESKKVIKNNDSMSGFQFFDKFDMFDYKDLIRNLEQVVKNDLSVPDGASMTVWVNNGHIVKRTFETIAGDETGRIGISTETSGLKASDGKYRTYAGINITDRSDSTDNSLNWVFKGSSYYDRSKKVNINKGEMEFTTKVSQEMQYRLGFDWDSEIKNSYGKKTTSTQYNLQLGGGIITGEGLHVYGDVIHSASENAKLKTLYDDLTISTYLEPGVITNGGKYGGKLQLVTERAYNTAFKLPEFPDNKVVDLSRVSSTDIDELSIEMGKSITKYIEKNPKLNDIADFQSLADMLKGNVLKQPVSILPSEVEESSEDSIYTFEEFNRTYTLNGRGEINYTDSKGDSVKTSIMPVGSNHIQKVYYGTYKGRLVFITEISDYESGISCLSTVDHDLKGKPWEEQLFGGFNTGESFIEGNLIFLNAFGYVGAVNLDNGQTVWKHDDLAEKYDANSFSLMNSEGETLEYEASTNASEKLEMRIDKKSGEIISVTDSSGQSISEPTVTKIGFARSLNPDTFAPNEVLTSFNTSDNILYYVVYLDRMPPGVDIQYTWSMNGEQFSQDSSYLNKGASGLYFQTNYMIGEYGSFPPGMYSVELVGTKYGVELFRIQDSIELTANYGPI